MKDNKKIRRNIDLISTNVVEEHNIISRCFQEVGFSEITIYCILLMNLVIKSYKVQTFGELKSLNHAKPKKK